MSEYIFKANFKIDNCLTCPVANIVTNCPCFTGQAYATDFCDSKHPNCPLVELPPHGDLIDRSKLVLHGRVDDFGDLQEMNDYYDATEVMNAPTVLEANKEN